MNPADCQITSKYVVTGIRHVEHGEQIGTIMRIQYSYDENGIIHIQARQGQADCDLPIRREEITEDVSVFGMPINGEQNNQSSLFGVQMGGNQKVVHKYKAITFSNVAWQEYDNILRHPSGARYNEPSVHIIANEKRIEFHGYNVSEMDEGVRYTIPATDDFEIECDVDTSTISPHPGGYLRIDLGIVSARLNENGGEIIMQGKSVATVGSCFHLKMSLTDGGNYKVEIDQMAVGNVFESVVDSVEIVFGFVHGSHCCAMLSHAYIKDISMMQCQNGDDESADCDTWDN